MFSASAGVSVARSATVSAGPACQTTKVAPIAGSFPGQLRGRPVLAQEAADAGLLPRHVGAGRARVAARRGDRSRRLDLAGDERGEQRGRREHTQQAQAPRPLGDRVLAQHEHRQRPPGGEPCRDRERGLDVTERQAQRGQRPGGSRGHVGRQAGSEQHAIEEERARQRHRPAPGLRNLEVDLRANAQAERVARHGDEAERDRGDHDRAATDHRAERAERDEDRGRPEREPGRERRSCSSPVTRGTHGADHREASGRPGAGEPDEQRGQDERRRQHAIFVS